MMCNCHSYNLDLPFSGKDESDVIYNPFTKKEVSVDHCISDVIQAIWEAGINTHGCCCGHNKEKPNVILDDAFSDKQKELVLNYANQVRDIIERLDGREWDIYSWQLTKI